MINIIWTKPGKRADATRSTTTMFQAVESAAFQTTTKMTTTLKISLNSETSESDDTTLQQDASEKEISLPVKVYKNISQSILTLNYGLLITNPILRCSWFRISRGRRSREYSWARFFLKWLWWKWWLLWRRKYRKFKRK